MSVFVHTQTGGIKVNDPEALTLRVDDGERPAGQPADDREDGGQADGHPGRHAADRPQQLICQLIGGGVPERFPDLHFSLIEFNAHWLSSLVGSMDKCWVTGVGQDADWWIGVWDDDRPDDDQPGMAQLFRLNEKWPYPLMPSEYVQRQFHVSFQDDPVAVACRHITGCRRSCGATTTPTPRARSAAAASCWPAQMAGVPDDERKAPGRRDAGRTPGARPGGSLNELRFDGRVAVVNRRGARHRARLRPDCWPPGVPGWS
jgi:hypothetical protein